ncbi:MAG: enoyl-CoA hydratase/isomerase family protein [Gammaproteobacteria bacterium]|nr:enoyl-CoA hydratase/isomerase family protein [Gammaproteobacteria bacterium]
MNEPVVMITELSPSIVQITMQDKMNKNTFSENLILGLIDAFNKINQNSNYKAVILTGYDHYFASGGTQESLLALQSGQIKFTDVNIYSLALECPIPVISAMQGHGIGGGFVMGLFADFVILSQESIYTTNFMKYGFTPGMGATLILPKKLGISLSEEMLLLAKTYRGEELQLRGVSFPVLPRNEVVAKAIEIANLLAEKPRVSLITLKKHMTKSLQDALPHIIEEELIMHEITIHQPEVKLMIEEQFVKKLE